MNFDSLNPLEQLDHLARKIESAPVALVVAKEDSIDATVVNFFDQSFNPAEELKAQRKLMGKGCDDIDFNKVKANKTLCISSKFDLIEWWLYSLSHHSIAYVTVRTLVSLPNSNAFQERTFSTYTHFDDPLRQSLEGEYF